VSAVEVRVVDASAAEAVHAVVAAAFADRPPLDPPADALGETPETLAAALAEGGGMVAEVDGEVVGALILDPEPAGGRLWIRRFGVLPAWQEHGVGATMVEAALALAGGRPAAVLARAELPRAQAFWHAHGFVEVGQQAPYVVLVRPAETRVAVPDADAMRGLGRDLAAYLRAGDLLVLTGGLGAGKTTFTQGIGSGLEVRGDVTSPTFVIARVHPSLREVDGAPGPALVHVDAYRLGGLDELDDLDLDTSLEESVTVVEWGAGLAEQLADDRLEVVISRAVGAEATLSDGPDADLDLDAPDERVVHVRGHGARWTGVTWPPPV